MNKESLLKNVPQIPYRTLTVQEQQILWDYARKLKDRDSFWQQTEKEARKILKIIKKGEFVIGGELGWGSPLEGYGVHSHIYKKGYIGKKVKETCDYDNVIGNVDLWEAGGFNSNPVQLWYQNLKVINDVLELRDYLIRNNISFCDGINISYLEKEVSDLERKKRDKLEIISRVKEIQLRKN